LSKEFLSREVSDQLLDRARAALPKSADSLKVLEMISPALLGNN